MEVTFGGNAYLGNSTNTVMQLAGPVAGSQYDQITVTGQLVLAGDLNVVLLNGFQPQAGESFQLFEGDLSGSFSQLTLPALSNGLSWNTSNLDTNGTISVVPEPSTLALLGVGAFGLLAGAWRRRRAARGLLAVAFATTLLGGASAEDSRKPSRRSLFRVRRISPGSTLLLSQVRLPRCNFLVRRSAR